jgi:hypothetical protein
VRKEYATKGLRMFFQYLDPKRVHFSAVEGPPKRTITGR